MAAIKIDRSELADDNTPTGLGGALLRQLPDLTLPVPIDEIALACDITAIEALKTVGIDGMLLTDDAKSEGVIFASARNGERRRRFSVGHELGHFLNAWHVAPPGGFQCTAEQMLYSDAQQTKDRMQMEAEANAFAAEVLMPRPMFLSQFRAAGNEPTIQVLLRVADDFLVSKLAAARRLVGMRRDLATVLSHGGSIEQIYRGQEFPFVSLKRGQPVPRGSVTHQERGPVGTVSAIEEIEPATWTSSGTRKSALFLEQVLVQTGGYTLTLLALDESGCDDEEDGDDDGAREVGERSTWNPTFHRSRRKP